jgi:hypothetical protein
MELHLLLNPTGLVCIVLICALVFRKEVHARIVAPAFKFWLDARGHGQPKLPKAPVRELRNVVSIDRDTH